MPLEGGRIGDSCGNRFFCGTGKCFVLFCRRHFFHFVCNLTVSQAWLRNHSRRNSIRITVMTLNGRRIGNSCCHRIFWVDGKCSVSFCRRHFLQFDFDLTVSQAWLRHHSTRNSNRNTVVLSDRRRIGNSCRNPFFCDDGKCFFSFCRRHFLHFVCDLTVFRAWLRHHSTRNSIRITMIPLNGRRIGNSCRNPFFCDQVSVLSPSLFSFRLWSHRFSTWLRHQSTQILISNAVMLPDWRGIKNSSRNRFFCDDGKCSCCFCCRHFL